ncbi:MAG: serine/threonine-protein kinase [Myxococcota bacterium]
MESQAGSRNLEIVLLHELSSGTFARLYLAEARAPGGIDRIVAVKILREQWNESQEIINRTRDEARLLARLRHKNILRVEDMSAIDGQLAIIMEFVDGLDLKQVVEALAKKGAKIPPRAALQACADTCAALEAAYFKVPYGLDAPINVVHRDIKPSNVMVSVEGELKVLDFGTARADAAFRSVQTGALRFGSLKYMSPERREGDRGEHNADIYAVGLMLVEFFRGEWLPLLPLDAAEHDEQVTHVVNSLSGLGMPNREWDVALRQLLVQMLASNPAVRPNAQQVTPLLRSFAEQASGASLERFAAETVAPLAKQIRGNLAGGALAGTRFVVSVYDPAALGKPSITADKPAGAPAPKPAANAAPPARASLDDRPTSPDVLNESADRPTTIGQRIPLGAPESDQSTLVSKQAASDATAWTPRAAAPAPQPSIERSPRREPASRAPDPEPPAKSGGSGLAIAAGGFVVVGLLTCGGLGLAGAGWWFFASGDTPAPVTSGASAAPPVEPPPPAAGSAPVSITTEGNVQWVRVEDGAGKRVLDGQEKTEGKLAPGDYTLTMKQVGRPALKASLAVPEAGVSLACVPEKEGAVKCTGAGRPIVLK